MKNRIPACASLVALVWIVASIATAQQNAGGTTMGASNAVPGLISYSGVLKDTGGQTRTGVTGATFLLYREQEGGTPLWMETQNVVPDATGRYTAQLGATTANGMPASLFQTGEARWLAVRINGGEEQARVPLVAVPYAMKAVDAETLGGLPVSAFVLAAPVSGGSGGVAAAAAASSDSPAVSPAAAVTGSGTANYVPLWTGASTVGNSILVETGSGSTARIGVNIATPGATLDVKGSAFVRGTLAVLGTGAGTAAAGKSSGPLNFTASVFNSGTGTAVGQTFRWQAEPAGNNTASPSATMNLLFATGTGAPAETGLSIANNGEVSFAAGQTFPGTGPGTITGVAAGSGLTGGGTSGAVTLSLDTTKVPELAAANTFTGNQAVNGNMAATGVVTGSSYQIGSNLFAFGSYKNANAFLGFAGNTTTTGTYNTASGYQALAANTSGTSNSALGGLTLVSNTTGTGNTAIGSTALYWNKGGSYNSAVGFQALNGNTSGGDNTASGVNALFTNSTGSNNTADGFSVLYWNSIGTLNTGSGYQALNNNTTGTGNTAAGADAAYLNTTGSSNAAFGAYSLYTNTTGSANTAFGYAALYFNTGGYNTGLGYQALNQNSDGINNTAAGYEALFSNTQGAENTAFGTGALYANTTPTNNTAVGFNALRFNITGGANTATGAIALYTNIQGGGNTADGVDALGSTIADDNTAVGAYALADDSSGEQNTAVGYYALTNNYIGNGLTCIGYNCQTGSDGLSNATAIGAHAVVSQSNSLVLGGTGSYAVKVGIGTETPTSVFTIAQGAGHPVSDSWETYSSRRWKTNIHTLPNALAKVEQLRGVSYDLKDSGKHEIGVIAEEVGAVVPELVSYEPNGKDARSVDYARLTALLIEATKQQQREIENLKSELRETRQTLKEVKAQVAKSQTTLLATK